MNTNTDGTAPHGANSAPRRGGQKAHMMLAVVALAVLALSMSAASVFAHSAFTPTDELIPMDITVNVTDVERIHGSLFDRWMFTVSITNNNPQLIEVRLSTAIARNFEGAAYCPTFPGNLASSVLAPSYTATHQLCVFTDSGEELIELDIDGKLPYTSDRWTSWHVLMVDSRQCENVPDNITCSAQSIDHIIRDIEPEPVQCEAPSQTPTTTGGMPNVGSAAYNTILNDIVLSFDGPVELAEEWRDNMSIRAETADGSVELEGLHRLTTNVMSPGSMMWLALAFSDYLELRDATEITLLMGPGTILYGDGRTNAGEIAVGLELVP